jgi:predicted RNA-binding Zn ribbon-like protein
MDKTISIATLPLRGGHPSLDFANTVDSRRGRWGPDVLVSYGDLLQWSEQASVLSPDQIESLSKLASSDLDGTTAALIRAKHLREAIYDVFSALAGERKAPERALHVLRKEYLTAHATRALTVNRDAIAWEWPNAVGLDAVTHRLAVEAVDLLTSPRARRVKECFGRNCGWLFLDTSRNGSRRWCSDAVCGSLSRVTRHRSQARAKPSCEEA